MCMNSACVSCFAYLLVLHVSMCVLVQAGLHDGTIAVFNVSIASNEPVLDSWSVYRF